MSFVPDTTDPQFASKWSDVPCSERDFSAAPSPADGLPLAVSTCSAAVDDPEKGSLNKPDRLEWFRDRGFGIFIH